MTDPVLSDALLFRRLSVYNFLSFGPDEVVLDLTQNLLTAVIGVNYDTGGEDSRNGTGKSALLIDAVAYALFGKTIRGITNKNLVHKLARKGQPMGVTLEFSRGPFEYLIERGEPSRFLLFRKPVGDPRPFRHREKDPKDGKMKFIFDRTTAAGKTAKDEVVKAIGFDFTLFTYLVGVTSETVPFTKLDEAKRRDVVESLFGFKRLAEITVALKEDRDAVKKTLTEKESETNATEAANARIQTQIDALETKRAGYYEPFQRQKKIAELRFGEVFQHSKAICDEFYANDFVKSLPKDTDNLFNYVESLDTADARLNELKVAVMTAEKARDEIENGLLARRDAALDEYDVNANAIKEELRQQVLAKTKEFSEREAATNLNLRLFKDNEVKRARSTKLIAETTRKLKSLDIDAICPACGQTVNEAHRIKEVASLTEELNTEQAQLAALDAEGTALSEAVLAQTLDSIKSEANEFHRQVAQIGDDLLKERANIVQEWERDITTDENLIRAETAVAEARAVLETEQRLSMALTRAKQLVHEFNADTDATNELAEQIKEAERLLDPKQNPDPYQEQIESLRTNAMVDVSAVKAEIAELRTIIEHYQLLIELATKPDSFIRKNLVARWLPRLNQTINTTLRKLELPHRVTFDSEMEMEITNLNSDYSDGNLSKGERTRLVFALIRGFQDLYEHMNHSINLMAVDELIDSGICNRGAENAVNLLKESTQKDRKRIFLITHRSDIRDQVDSTLTVFKENDISRLRWDRE